MKTERELFEEWHNKEYADKLEWDSKKEEYKDYIDEVMWQTWQASPQREGYKLVPVEPSAKMLEIGSDALGGGKMGFATYMDVNNSYEAMIGASE